MSLADRNLQAELMDDPGLDRELHRQALIGLRRVNAVSRTVATLWKPIERLARTSGQPVKVLDVACGGGDNTTGLAVRAARCGLPVTVAGCDVSTTALEIARAHAESRQVSVRFFQADALAEPLPSEFDVVCCALFLHHLEESEIVRLLAAMKSAAGQMVLASDLVRSRLGYLLAWAGIRLLTRSRICHFDGPVSVQGALTTDEVLDLASRAGLEGVVLTRHWPQRFLLRWSSRS